MSSAGPQVDVDQRGECETWAWQQPRCDVSGIAFQSWSWSSGPPGTAATGSDWKASLSAAGPITAILWPMWHCSRSGVLDRLR